MLKFITVLLLAGAAGVYLALDRSSPSTDPAYITNPVKYEQLEEFVFSTGTVDALFTVDISSQVSGRITQVGADFNDSVKRGQPLAKIDKQEFEARVAEAEAAVNIALAAVEVQEAALKRSAVEVEVGKLERAVYRARIDQAGAKLAVAQSNLGRREALHRSRTISASDIEKDRAAMLTSAAALREAEALMAANEQRIKAAKANFTRSEAELTGARANVPQRRAMLKLAQVELERTTIRTPIDGIIINRSIEEGQTVAAALEAPTLFTIAKALQNMVVYVSVDETDIGRIRIGQPVVFTVDAFPEQEFIGEVTEIRKSAKVIQNIVTYTVVVKTKNPEELLFPGMTALVKIAVRNSEPGLKILTNSFSYRPRGKADNNEAGDEVVVWRLDQSGEPEPVVVIPGESDASHSLVTSNELKEGDLVIQTEIEQQAKKGLFGLFKGKG